MIPLILILALLGGGYIEGAPAWLLPSTGRPVSLNFDSSDEPVTTLLMGGELATSNLLPERGRSDAQGGGCLDERHLDDPLAAPGEADQRHRTGYGSVIPAQRAPALAEHFLQKSSATACSSWWRVANVVMSLRSRAISWAAVRVFMPSSIYPSVDTVKPLLSSGVPAWRPSQTRSTTSMTQPARTIAGPATWYPASGNVAAAGPSLRRWLGSHWRSTTLRICTSTCVIVIASDWCACPHGRLIDLSDDAFRQLAPLSAGVIRVTITRLGPPHVRIELPATDTE